MYGRIDLHYVLWWFWNELAAGEVRCGKGRAVIDDRSCDNSCTYRSFLSLRLTYRMGGKYADRCTDRFHRCGVRILSAAIETAESAL